MNLALFHLKQFWEFVNSNSIQVGVFSLDKIFYHLTHLACMWKTSFNEMSQQDNLNPFFEGVIQQKRMYR